MTNNIIDYGNSYQTDEQKQLDMRDHFAGLALASLAKPHTSSEDPARVARWAYSVADAMLVARTRKSKFDQP